jgi:hypothetical protein
MVSGMANGHTSSNLCGWKPDLAGVSNLAYCDHRWIALSVVLLDGAKEETKQGQAVAKDRTIMGTSTIPW